MLTADGKLLKYHGYGTVKLDVGLAQPVNIEVLVVDGTLLRFDMLLGIDAIWELGGMCTTKLEEVCFPEEDVLQCPVISINEPDFSLQSNHQKKFFGYGSGIRSEQRHC